MIDNDGIGDKCNYETLQDSINAAMVIYTPENYYHDMNSDKKSNSDI